MPHISEISLGFLNQFVLYPDKVSDVPLYTSTCLWWDCR